MVKKKTNTVTINGEDHNVDDLNEAQITMINHVSDLDRKISSTQFNLNQLQVGKQAFMQMLTNSLEVKEAAE
jgi:hypothetical protein|tara:strand:- start:997 stop:1212 length:216 start_codon:yes stop_codon:yes gene_type:complete